MEIKMWFFFFGFLISNPLVSGKNSDNYGAGDHCPVSKGKGRLELERKTILRMDDFAPLVGFFKLTVFTATRCTDNVQRSIPIGQLLKLSGVGAFSSFCLLCIINAWGFLECSCGTCVPCDMFLVRLWTRTRWGTIYCGSPKTRPVSGNCKSVEFIWLN